MTLLPPQGQLNLLSVLQAAYPVGSIYMAVVSTSPATLFGFGTWSAFGAGRVPVGLDSGDSDFNAAEKTGGEKTHVLSTTELAAHTHPINAPSSSYAMQGTNTNEGSNKYWKFNSDYNLSATDGAGGGGAHNNVQPYIVVYMWKRTA